MRSDQLPRVDEHATEIGAGVDDVWRALTETLDAAMSRPWTAAFSRIVGCAETRASGPRPLTEASTIPGFRVTAAIPGVELALQGRHRFRPTPLIFRLERVLVVGRSERRTAHA